jgi:hypothetical protein
MATVALTVREYNDLVVRAAFTVYRRVIQTPETALDAAGKGEIPGTPDPALADPHKQRGFDTGLYDARTRGDARRGGRPRVHASQRQAQAAAARAYRLRTRLARAAGAR